jgi:hypothetical protein
MKRSTRAGTPGAAAAENCAFETRPRRLMHFTAFETKRRGLWKILARPTDRSAEPIDAGSARDGTSLHSYRHRTHRAEGWQPNEKLNEVANKYPL